MREIDPNRLGDEQAQNYEDIISLGEEMIECFKKIDETFIQNFPELVTILISVHFTSVARLLRVYRDCEDMKASEFPLFIESVKDALDKQIELHMVDNVEEQQKHSILFSDDYKKRAKK